MTILLFGITRDIVGQGTLEIPESTAAGLRTIGDLKTYLIDLYPELDKLSSLAVAVNQHYATDEDLVGNADEIALIPPVSGG